MIASQIDESVMVSIDQNNKVGQMMTPKHDLMQLLFLLSHLLIGK